MAHQGSGVAGLLSRHRHTSRSRSHSGLAAAAAGPPVAGYLAWWDATTITGVADGAALAAWPDLSANHNDLAATGSAQPVYYKTTGGQLVNGLPAVSFNGSSQYLKTAGSVAQAGPFTVVAVVTCANLSANHTLFASNNGTDQLLIDTSGTWYLFAAGGPWTTTVHMTTSGVHFVAAQFTGDPSSLTQDATTQTGSGAGAAALASTFYWMAGNAGSQWWAGRACEGGVYPFALTGPQLAALRAYAQTKWGTP